MTVLPNGTPSGPVAEKLAPPVRWRFLGMTLLGLLIVSVALWSTVLADAFLAGANVANVHTLAALSLGSLTLVAACVGLLVRRLRSAHAQQRELSRLLQQSREEVTRAREAEQQAHEQVRKSGELHVLGMLSASVAHDFNNLVSVMLSDIAALKARTAADKLEELDDVEQAARAAADLCRRLLALSGERVSSMGKASLNQLVEAELPLLRRLVTSRVRVVWQPGPDTWFMASRTEFRQLLLNLCVNARDSMPQGGELRLASTVIQASTLSQTSVVKQSRSTPGSGEDLACLTISDTGTGMDENTQAHLYEPFFTTKDANKGTGLGMSVVAAAVATHNAQIDVQSELGKGTIVSICFPAVAPDAVTDPAIATPRAEALLSKETILVVDDDELIRRSVSRTLRRHGYQVLTANDGREGLAALALKKVDMVICDGMMPNMDGPALFAHVSREHPSLPFLFCSGSMDYGIPDEETDGPVSILPKPFTEQSLLQCVRELLATRHAPKHGTTHESNPWSTAVIG